MSLKEILNIMVIIGEIMLITIETRHSLKTKKLMGRNIFNYITYITNIISSVLIIKEIELNIYISFIAIIVNAIFLTLLVKDIRQRKIKINI